MDAVRVLDLVALLRTSGIPAWLDGGWAVDALLGEQTREHDDLDLVTRLEDSARLEEALGERGYSTGYGAPPHSFELVDSAGHQVDVHPASFTPDGDGVYKLHGGGDWIYPAAGFLGVGRILGEEIACLTPEVVLVNHSTGYVLDPEHERDVRALAARYGLPVPDFRTS
jgi:lincosamide nucleotidyltransferase A/C/D/E